MAHVVFVRSPLAHGTITSVDIGEAESMPGVVAVYWAADGKDLGLPAFQGFPMMPAEVNRPIFAKDRVRFVGDIVAAVVAETRAQAVDAAEAVIVDYDPLPAVTTAAAALAADAPILFPEHGSNVCFATTFGDDVDALEGAESVAEVTMVSQRLAGVPMECNGIVAVPGEPDGGHHVLGLAPGTARRPRGDGAGPRPRARAAARRLPVGRRRLRSEGRACTSSTSSPRPRPARSDRPVKWTETRSEDMVSLVHGRDYVMTAKLGTKLDGTIIGLDAKIVASGGAYPAIGAILPMLTQMMSPGVYDVPEGPLRRDDGDHQHHDDRRLPRRRAAGGDAADRACDRRRRRPARHRPGRDPSSQLPPARRRSR